MNLNTGYLDKNANELYVGMTVRNCGTVDDYTYIQKGIITVQNGKFYVNDELLTSFIPEGSKYATLEIV